MRNWAFKIYFKESNKNRSSYNDMKIVFKFQINFAVGYLSKNIKAKKKKPESK